MMPYIYWSDLVQEMACHLLSDKPLPEPILTYWQLDHHKQPFNKNIVIFIQENAFGNVFCIMPATLYTPQCVQHMVESTAWPGNVKCFAPHSCEHIMRLFVQPSIKFGFNSNGLHLNLYEVALIAPFHEPQSANHLYLWNFTSKKIRLLKKLQGRKRCLIWAWTHWGCVIPNIWLNQKDTKLLYFD